MTAENMGKTKVFLVVMLFFFHLSQKQCTWAKKSSEPFFEEYFPMAEYLNPSGSKNRILKSLFFIVHRETNFIIWFTVLIAKGEIPLYWSIFFKISEKNVKNQYEILYFPWIIARFYYFPPKIPLFLQICPKIPLEPGSQYLPFMPSGSRYNEGIRAGNTSVFTHRQKS